MCVSVTKECECCQFAAGAAFIASGRGLVSGSLRNHGRRAVQGRAVYAMRCPFMLDQRVVV